MPSTYEPIATTTLGSAASNITFSSISSSYTDLVLIVNGGFSSLDALAVQVNSDTGSNYSTTILNGDGSSAISWRSTSASRIYMNYSGLTANSFSGAWVINFQNYSNTTTNKTVLGRYSGASNEVGASVGLWRSTSAINSIKIFANSGNNLLTSSTATLYGVKSA